MSVRVMTLVFERDLPHSLKFVLLALADHADDDGERIWPSVPALAEKVGLARRAVQYHLRTLEADGLLVLTKPSKRHRPNEYRIDLDALEAIPLLPGLVARRAARRGAPFAPLDSDGAPSTPLGVQKSARRGATNATLGAQPIAPESSVEPSVVQQPSKTLPTEKLAAAPRRRFRVDWAPRLDEADRTAHPIRYVLTYFDLGFFRRYQTRHPPMGGKEAKLCERVVGHYGLDRTLGFVDAFFEMESDWLRRTGHTWNIFVGQVGQIIARTSTGGMVDVFAGKTLDTVNAGVLAKQMLEQLEAARNGSSD